MYLSVAKYFAAPGLWSVITIRANAREVDDIRRETRSRFDDFRSRLDAIESKLDSVATNVALLVWRQDSHEHRTKQLEKDMSLLKQAGKE